MFATFRVRHLIRGQYRFLGILWSWGESDTIFVRGRGTKKVEGWIFQRHFFIWVYLSISLNIEISNIFYNVILLLVQIIDLYDD